MALILPTPPTLPASPPIVSNYIYRDLVRETKDNGVRHYLDPDSGTPLPSVTTVLSATADKEHIKLWEEWVGIEKANKVRTEATNLGNLMHTSLEDYMEGRERKNGSNLIFQMSRRMADTIIKNAFPFIDEVWGIESKLYFPELYAGTTDLVGVWKGKPAIMDYKTAKKIRTEDQIQDYFCQGAAYALAHNYHYDTDINQIAIFMVSRDLQFKCFEISGNEFYKYADEWQRRLLEYDKKTSAEAA